MRHYWSGNRSTRRALLGAAAAWALLGLTAPAAPQPPELPQALPRTAAGTPDLSGVWQALNAAHWNIEPHAASAGPVPALGAQGAVPPDAGVVQGGSIPYLPTAAARRDQNFKNRLTADPEIKCYRPGVPRAVYMPQPFQILQTDGDILIAYQYAGAIRTIYMSDPIEAPVDSWMGWSNGRWEGDTLVVEVTGQNGETWFDRAGNFGGGEGLKVVERYTPLGPNHLYYEATIENPEVFARPWTIGMPLYRRVEPDARLLEFKCPEFAEELMYGDLRKQADEGT